MYLTHKKELDIIISSKENFLFTNTNNRLLQVNIYKIQAAPL